ncbi:hypothetical protein DFP72DRAFT_1081308 [Ephemerocybe angulata]|uniref:Uncharacterized protein n=1 Tax=Ephemerocybe angulata TaxID=980116 RepID=A0A8H6HBJ2_9AGAR|nr:hypothetical protein DFP72DRAFT_1081308 [Tulosesus angulatus]
MEAELSAPSGLDGVLSRVATGQTSRTPRRPGKEKLTLKPIWVPQRKVEATQSDLNLDTKATEVQGSIPDNYIRQAISTLGIGGRTVTGSSGRGQPQAALTRTHPTEGTAEAHGSGIGGHGVESALPLRATAPSVVSHTQASSSRGPSNKQRFDLETYVKDLPQVRLVLLSIHQLSYLETIGNIGWCTEYRVLPADSQQVIYAFSEDNDSLEAISAYISIAESSDGEGSGASTPVFSLFPTNNHTTGMVIEDGDLPIVETAGRSDGDNDNGATTGSGDDSGPFDRDATIGQVRANLSNVDAPEDRTGNPLVNLHEPSHVAPRLSDLALIYTRLFIPFLVGGAVGGLVSWILLAYDVLPNVYVVLERLWLFSLGFLGREVILWAFHFTVRKVAGLVATFARRFFRLKAE